MNDINHTTALIESKKPASLLAIMGDRLGVDPIKLKDTLQKTVFKACENDEQFIALMIVANQYRLNPMTKEMYAFPDRKSGGVVPVVGVDGWSRIINEHPQYDGMNFNFSADGSECTCTIHRKDRTHPTVVTEYLAECSRGTDHWRSHPRRMLRHKAMIQAARIAFGFSGIYDSDEASAITESSVQAIPAGRAEPVETASHVQLDNVQKHSSKLRDRLLQQNPLQSPQEVDRPVVDDFKDGGSYTLTADIVEDKPA